MFSKFERVDIIFDRYVEGSLKQEERMKRGQGGRIKVKGSTKIPTNWNAFLQNDDNKKELFEFLAIEIAKAEIPQGKTLVATKNEGVVHFPIDFCDHWVSPCHHEEADTRIFLHAHDAAKKNHQSIMIKTVDSDIVIIALHAFFTLNLDQLWVDYGVGKNRRFLAIHDLAIQLGEEMCAGILFWHSFTGCDTVSAFAGHGKKTFWDTWKNNKNFSPTFATLSRSPKEISDRLFQDIQLYVIKAYDKTSNLKSVNQCRKHLVTKKNRALESIPPTEDALMQHVKRAAFQAGHIWGQWKEKCPVLPTPEDWGWKKQASSYRPIWTILPDASKHCKELVKCGCKSLCSTRRCKCKKLALPCSSLCFCDGQCGDYEANE